MAKTPDRETQYGKQFPNGAIEWQGPKVAIRLEWTTPSGRASVQREYNEHLQAIGIVPSTATDLKFFSRERFVGYTDAVELVDYNDVVPEPSTGDAPADVPDTVTTSVAIQAPAPVLSATSESDVAAVPTIGTVPA